MFFYHVNCYEILLCGKITSHATINIWIKSEIIEDYFKDFVYCFSMTVKKEKEEKEGGGDPQKVCTTGATPMCFNFKTFEIIL